MNVTVLTHSHCDVLLEPVFAVIVSFTTISPYHSGGVRINFAVLRHSLFLNLNC
jgi:hypothetical protein